MRRVLVPFMVLSTAAAIVALVMTARDSTASTSPLNLDKARFAPSPGEADPEPGREAVIPLSVVARVFTENGDRYVKTSFELVVARPQDRDKVVERLPHMRDAMISYFADCTLADLAGSAGIERTKQEVLRRLQRVIPQPLRALYVTDFVIAN